MHKQALMAALCLAAVPAALSAQGPSPLGLWLDHTGRAAIEITECGANLCGKVAWLKEGVNKKGCGIQIIGNVKPMGKDTWDGGWITDPERGGGKYSVELKLIGTDKLRVMGYAGSKFFNETMMWKRADPDLKRCEVEATAAPASPSEKKDTPAPAATDAPKAPAKDAGKKPVEPAKGKTADKVECKKYLPQTGQMITVPCEK